jgi:hypothetical protein
MEDQSNPGWDEWLWQQTEVSAPSDNGRTQRVVEVLDDDWNLSTVERSTPPIQPGRRAPQPKHLWPRRFADARRHRGEWVKIVTAMSRSTAAQLASDIRRIGLRDPKSIRVKGYLPDERWDAAFGNDPSDQDPSRFYIWVRLRDSES